MGGPAWRPRFGVCQRGGDAVGGGASGDVPGGEGDLDFDGAAGFVVEEGVVAAQFFDREAVRGGRRRRIGDQGLDRLVRGAEGDAARARKSARSVAVA